MAQGCLTVTSTIQLKDTRAGNASLGSATTSTLLHYVVKVLQKEDGTLIQFIDESPHVQAASRGGCEHRRRRKTSRLKRPAPTDFALPRLLIVSIASILTSVDALTNGVEDVKTEVSTLKAVDLANPSDRFIVVMEVSKKTISSTSFYSDRSRTRGN